MKKSPNPRRGVNECVTLFVSVLKTLTSLIARLAEQNGHNNFGASLQKIHKPVGSEIIYASPPI